MLISAGKISLKIKAEAHITRQETMSHCYCKEVKRPKQSHKTLKAKSLSRSPWLLVMTGGDYDTTCRIGI